MSFTTSPFRPDLRIGTKRNSATHRGNNIYNVSGAGQVASVQMKGRRPVTLHFSVENDGDGTDRHIIRATKASKKLGTVRYFRTSGGRANLTAAATRSGAMSANVGPGALVSYEMRARRNGKKHAAQTLRFGVTSVADSRGADAAQGKVVALAIKKRGRK